MFDTFEAMRILKMQAFAFKPSKFDVWESQKVIATGATTTPIISEVHNTSSGKPILKIEFKDESLSKIFKRVIYFDVFFTQNDRLTLATIPKARYSDSNGLNTLRAFLGETNSEKLFASNEPYCCNLFLKDGVIKQISFSFNNPVRLVEFASGDEIKKNKNSLLVAKQLIESLIANCDDEDAYAPERNLKNNVQTKYGFQPTYEEIKEAVSTINSIFPSHNNIVRTGMAPDFQTLYISSFDLGSLKMVRSSILKLLGE